jgi:hypothetical protein
MINTDGINEASVRVSVNGRHDDGVPSVFRFQ